VNSTKLKYSFTSFFTSLLPFIILFLNSCEHHGNKTFPTLNINLLGPGEEIEIKEWQVVGPFPDRLLELKQKTAIDRDDLYVFGMTENKIASDSILACTKKNALFPHRIPNNFVNQKIKLQSNYFDFIKLLKQDVDTQNGNVYVACHINSSVEQEIVFFTGSDDGMKLWLNNEELYRIDAGSHVRKYDNFIRTRLKKGINFLLAKVNTKGTSWHLSIRFGPLGYAKDKYLKNKVSEFLEKSIIQVGESLQLNFDLFTKDTTFIINILDTKKTKIKTQSYQPQQGPNFDLDSLKEGLYCCQVVCSQYVFEQFFYYGGLGTHLAHLKGRISELQNVNERIQININALISRIEHLVDHKKEHGESYDYLEQKSWQDKIVFVCTEIESIFSNLQCDKEAIKGISGTHIRGYRSIIDDQIQHYLVHIPAKYQNDKKPLPLVIVLPFHTVTPRPFLKNYPLANHPLIKRTAAIAEKYGFAVLWPNSRIPSGRNIYPVGEKGIFEALNEVKKSYSIDEDRIYLNGTCAGARSALLLAARYPSQFAAIGVTNLPSDLDDVFSLSNSLFHSKQQTDFIENLYSISVYILHGDLEEETPIKNSKSFAKKAQSHKVNVDLEIKRNATTDYSYYEYVANPFLYFNNKKRNSTPDTIIFSTSQLKYNSAYWVKINQKPTDQIASINAVKISEHHIIVNTGNVFQYEIDIAGLILDRKKKLKITTNGQVNFFTIPKDNRIVVNVPENKYFDNDVVKSNKIEGPLTHAFADNFVVVEGTLGTEKEHEKIHNIATKFCAAWEKTFFVKCRYKTDKQIDSTDISNSHLFLIGNQFTNSIIKAIIHKIPLKIGKDKLVIGEKEYLGDKLGFHMIYPNPLNSEKYIVLIGANNINYFQLGENNLSHNGWHDYTIWKYPSTTHAYSIDAGYFNLFWQ
jgi:hypothetical protein